MNNPYRARPGRPRVDHAGVSNYGVQNQNSWGSMPAAPQPGIPPTTGFPTQTPSVIQPNQGGVDPWDWGSENNGNDSWNWTVDQQSESKPLSQQQQQQQQPPQYVPSYPNNMQSPPNPGQESYYKTINGNNRPITTNPAHQNSGGNTPRTAPSRESTPQLADGYSNYSNYSTNQQHPVPPRPNSAKISNTIAGTDHGHWPTNQQQQQQQQQQPSVVDHAERQTCTFNPYFQPNPLSFDSKGATPVPPHQPVINDYSWNTGEQPNVPVSQQEQQRQQQQPQPPHNWQNHSEVGPSGYWQDNTNIETESRYKSSGNQWQQEQHNLQQAQSFPPVANVMQNQWQNPSRETDQSNQRSQIPPTGNHGAQVAWNQPKNSNTVQSWQQVPLQDETGQWPQSGQGHDGSSILSESSPEDENVSGRLSSKEWTRIKPPLGHFASSTASTTSGSIPNLSSSADPVDDRKKSLATSVASSMSLNDSPTEGKAPTLYQAPGNGGNWTAAASETNSISDNSENVLAQDNVDIDWQADGESGEWASRPIINELSMSVGQLNLGSNKSPGQHDNHAPLVQTSYDRATRHISLEENPQIPSLPVRDPSNSGRFDSQADTLPQDSTGYSSNTVNPPEGIPTNYDQWYNQSASQTQQNAAAGAAGAGWYNSDRTRTTQQWTPEQNVENYENIQQPTEFVNLEVVTPVLQERDIYGSRESINKETLDNDPKPVGVTPKEAAATGARQDSSQESSNIEVPSLQQIQQSTQPDQTPENYEFASNDRNTFLETGELTDSHHEHESTPPSQDDENDEVPSDIPFLREVPGQSSSADPRRNDPTGQEQYVQSSPRVIDPRRNDPSGQAQGTLTRNLSERRDVPPGQERNQTISNRVENETFERRNDPSGRERSIPPAQSRNDPSGEERAQTQTQSVVPEPNEIRRVPGSRTSPEESLAQTDNGVRQIPGGASPPNEPPQITDERNNTRVVTGSRQVGIPVLSATMQDSASETRSKREEAVGASVVETLGVGNGPPNRRDSYEDGDDEGSANSRDESGERRRDPSPTGDRRRYDYYRKGPYYDRDREFDDDYYYDRRRGPDFDRAYNSREDLDRRDASYREGERRRTSRDDSERHCRDDAERRGRIKDDTDDRDGRRRVDERRRDRVEDPRRREREDPRYPPRDREYPERRRDDRRPRRYDDYDPRDPPSRREYYEDPYSRSSRPSSRSSYNDRERDYYTRSRDPYYNYNAPYNGYDYGSTYNRDYYAYLENLRRTNPAAYSEWYHKYYANQHQQQAARGVSNYQEDRASVHSGRSSCEDRLLANPSFCFHAPNKSLYVSYFGCHGHVENGRLYGRHPNLRNFHRTTTSEKRTLNDLSVLEDTRIASSRLTPTKFSTSHVIGTMSIGSLLHVHACYPADGERAKVDILRLDCHLMNDPVARELRAYPGPLIKQVGVTHKKTIIEYCESKIKKAAVNDDLADRASYILLYELMIMLIQQNGNVVGVDIAQLLLRNKDAYPYNVHKPINEPVRRESTISQRSGGNGGDGVVVDDAIPPMESTESVKQRKTVEQMTDEFRKTLLYGLVQEALEYAMTEGLWGHALFLASKLDKRTHASVMTRFANSLPVQDPLQTLYQLHSGRVPASVTCVSDPKWDDWRPHLAMIISNTSGNPDINRRSITNLGDTLAARGDIHAAHFSYILAQIDFGPYGGAGVKLVLIGSNHHKRYADFLLPEAIMLTEIYEYARHLSEPGFTLIDLQTFKFESVLKMVDYGLIEKALLYLEQIAVNIVNDPVKYKSSFIEQVYTLGDRIKYHDPVYKDSAEDVANLAWLNNLAEIVGSCQTGEILRDTNGPRRTIDSQNNIPEEREPQSSSVWRETTYLEGPNSMMELPSNDTHNQQSEWQPLSLPATVADSYNNVPEHGSRYTGTNTDPNQYQRQQQDYWNQQSYAQQEYQTQDFTTGDWQNNQTQYQHEQTDVDSSRQASTWNYESEKEEKSSTPEPQPTISMGPSSGKQYDPLEELDALEQPKDASKSATESKKPSDKGTDKKNSSTGGSWFGGLFSKLAPKPRNQMILPDDSNPTIVWDPVGKKWTNKDEDGEDGESASSRLAPPPKAADMGYKPSTVEPTAGPRQQIPQLDIPSDRSTTPNTSKTMTGSNMFKMPKGRNMRANYIDVMNPGGNKGTPVNSNIPTPATSPLVPMATSSPQLFIPAPVNDPAAPVDFLSSTVSAGPVENSNQPGPTMYNPTDVQDGSMINAPRNRYPPR